MKEVDELVERTRLTDEEIRAAHPYWNNLSDDAVKRVGVIAKAQQDKVLKDPDLALIDRKKEVQVIIRDYFELPGNEFLAKYPDVEKEAYWNGEEGEGLMQALEKFKFVIPLAKEVGK